MSDTLPPAQPSVAAQTLPPQALIPVQPGSPTAPDPEQAPGRRLYAAFAFGGTGFMFLVGASSAVTRLRWPSSSVATTAPEKVRVVNFIR